MIGLPFKKLIFGLLLLGGLGVAGAALVWHGSKEPPPELPTLVDFVYEQAVNQIVENVTVPTGKNIIGLHDIPGDGNDALRLRLLRKLNRRGGLEALLIQEPESSNYKEKIIAVLRSWAPESLGGKKPPEINVDLYARIVDFQDNDDRVRLEVEWAEGYSEGALLAKGRPAVELEKSLFSFDYMQLSIGESSRFWRFLSWSLLVMMPPFLFLPVIRRGLKEDSNFVNAGMLLAFAVPGIIAGWVLSAFGQGFVGGGLTLLAMLASATFAFCFLTLVEHSRK